jgi:hypothetical protein
MDQLEGQIASAKIAMARLSSPQLYYVLSRNDFTLNINNPDEPKIVCMGNNPQKIQIYGAILSLYVNRLIKLVNKKGKLKSSLIFNEFPAISGQGTGETAKQLSERFGKIVQDRESVSINNADTSVSSSR